MESIDYHYYLHITVINTNNLKKKKSTDYAHKQEKRDIEMMHGAREGASSRERERDQVDHIYLLVIEVEIEHRLPELQDVAVLVVLVMER